MNKITLISALLSAFLSVAAVAEEHADTAFKHTNMAVHEGKAGHNAALAKHAKETLTHAIKAAEVTAGESKTHMQAAIKSLESAIEHGKMQGKQHTKPVTQAAEEAAEHIKAGNQ
ncbi:MAG: small metal-binding protein SmbP [Methylomicrobium sp.]